jgi:hypothetical protein
MKIRKDTVVEIDISSSIEEMDDDSCQMDSELVIDEKECMGEFVTDYAFDESELDGEYHPDERYVAGYSVNETEIAEKASRDSYTNWEVNEYLGNYFRFFGQKDMDIIYLYFLSGKKQEDLVKILGKSQPAISYDVTRIKEQIDFVIKLVSSIDDFIMFIVDDDNRLNTYDREMLTLFFYSTSIVKTSRLMGINNITCRSHLNTVVNRLLANGHVDMYNLFKYIMSNLNNIKKYVPRGEQP